MYLFCRGRTTMTILQPNRPTDFNIVGYGECQCCKTGSDLVQSKTIECSVCGEPYLRNKLTGVFWCEWEMKSYTKVI